MFGIDGSGKSTGFFYFFITIASGATVVVQNNKISNAVARNRESAVARRSTNKTTEIQKPSTDNIGETTNGDARITNVRRIVSVGSVGRLFF